MPVDTSLRVEDRDIMDLFVTNTNNILIYKYTLYSICGQTLAPELLKYLDVCKHKQVLFFPSG